MDQSAVLSAITNNGINQTICLIFHSNLPLLPKGRWIAQNISRPQGSYVPRITKHFPLYSFKHSPCYRRLTAERWQHWPKRERLLSVSGRQGKGFFYFPAWLSHRTGMNQIKGHHGNHQQGRSHFRQIGWRLIWPNHHVGPYYLVSPRAIPAV